MAASSNISFAIVGCGMSGLCLAIKLKEAGIPFTIFEKSSELGGTWLDNTYPGCGCDVQSHHYSYSFELNPNWTHKWAPRAEILEYFQGCARKYGIMEHIRFRAEVEQAVWDEKEQVWRVAVKGADGMTEGFTSTFFVAATGQLSKPHTPKIPGQEAFGGPAFHSARWDHSVDLAGKDVAVIGNGASGIQFIPEIAQVARSVRIFQRTPSFVLPKQQVQYSPRWRWMFAHVPGLITLARWRGWLNGEMLLLYFKKGTLNDLLSKALRDIMRQAVGNDELAAKVVPTYPAFAARALISDNYISTLRLPHVSIETESVTRIAPGTVSTESAEHKADVIVYGTGFHTKDFCFPMEVSGSDGLSLRDAWRDVPKAFYGVTVPRFPNFFCLYGPNTNLGHNSIIFMVECQVGYILNLLEQTLRRGARVCDVRPEAVDVYNNELQTRMSKMVFTTKNVGWYQNADGTIVNNWCGSCTEYWWRTRKADLRHYTLA